MTDIDVEAESAAVKARSEQLVKALDAGHPVVEPIPAIWAERRRLAALTHQARRQVAARVAAGLDPHCVVSPQPPLRRVRTDWRGHDLDPLHGRSAVTDELVRFWEFQRDQLGPAVEASYRTAAERTPYREPLVAAARGHLALLRERRSMLSEGGSELEAAVDRYDQAFVNLRQSALEAQHIGGEAVGRLQSLRRIEAEAELGDDNNERGFLAAAISQMSDSGLVDAGTLTPLAVESGGK
jgi:hypothetical protein